MMPLFDARGSLRGLALFRLTLGPLVVYSLWPYLREVVAGTWYGARYHAPWFASLPTPSAPAWHALIVAGALAAPLITLGLFARTACVVAALSVGGNVLLSETHYHHNRAVLVVALLLTALAGPGRELSLDAVIARRRGVDLAPEQALLWPLWLLRFEFASTYVASATSKLLDADWRSGTVLWDRVLQARPRLDESPLPSAVVELLSSPTLHAVLAPSAIALEMFVGLGLWSRRTRLAAVAGATMFHALVEVTARVQVFSYLCLAALAIWAVPRVRDRVLRVRTESTPGARLLGRVRHLDWLARFRVEEFSAPAHEAGGSRDDVTLCDRDGRVFTGDEAVRRTRLRLPLTFGPALIATLVATVRHRRFPGRG
jgi:hypothetical protein